jgi:hypothetical protein
MSMMLSSPKKHPTTAWIKITLSLSTLLGEKTKLRRLLYD